MAFRDFIKFMDTVAYALLICIALLIVAVFIEKHIMSTDIPDELERQHEASKEHP